MAMTQEEKDNLRNNLKNLAATSKAKREKEKELKRVAKQKEKPSFVSQTSAHKKPETVRVIDQWKDIGVVLLVNRMACAECGVVHEAPNPYPFLKKSHPTKGLHYEALKPERYRSLSRLPHEIEYQEGTTPACQECFKFGLSETFEEIYEQQQLAQG